MARGTVVITSAELTDTPEGEIESVAVERANAWRVRTPKLPISPNGTGDLFAALQRQECETRERHDIDAHAFPIRLGPFTVRIFPYKVHFQSLRTVVIFDEPLSKDFNTAAKQLYTALRNCRCYGSNLRWGDTTGFDFWAENKSARAGMGESIALASQTVLSAQLPQSARVVIVSRPLASGTTWQVCVSIGACSIAAGR
jgi:hypothetical protein